MSLGYLGRVLREPGQTLSTDDTRREVNRKTNTKTLTLNLGYLGQYKHILFGILGQIHQPCFLEYLCYFLGDILTKTKMNSNLVIRTNTQNLGTLRLIQGNRALFFLFLLIFRKFDNDCMIVFFYSCVVYDFNI